MWRFPCSQVEGITTVLLQVGLLRFFVKFLAPALLSLRPSILRSVAFPQRTETTETNWDSHGLCSESRRGRYVVCVLASLHLCAFLHARHTFSSPALNMAQS